MNGVKRARILAHRAPGRRGRRMVVLLALFAMFDLSSKNSAQVTQKVDATRRAKPAIQNS